MLENISFSGFNLIYLGVANHTGNVAKIKENRKLSNTYFMTGIPAAWSLSTAHLGGTPTAQTNKDALLLIIISMSSGNWPPV
jgi:hypothetical protein